MQIFISRLNASLFTLGTCFCPAITVQQQEHIYNALFCPPLLLAVCPAVVINFLRIQPSAMSRANLPEIV